MSANIFVGLCILLSGLHLSFPENSSANLKRLYTYRCSKDADCTSNAYCFGRGTNSFCTCNDGYIPHKENDTSPLTCIKASSNIDDYCELDIQCESPLGRHAICKKDNSSTIGKCSCQEDAHYMRNYCYKTAYINGICEVNENCLLASRDIQAFCEYGRCSCPPHHHSILNGKDCAKTSELYGPCIRSEGCIVPDSECRGGFCQCTIDAIPNYQNTSCLIVAGRTGDPCSENTQCAKIPLSVCIKEESLCKCREGAHEVDGFCWRTAKFSEPCKHNQECKSILDNDEGIICNYGKCECMTGYRAINNSYCMSNNPKNGNNSGHLNILSGSIFSTCIFISFMLCKLLKE